MDIKLQSVPRSRISEFTLFLISHDDEDICGVVKHNISDNRWFFTSIASLIKTLSTVIDYLNFPQAGMVMRSWSESTSPPVTQEHLKDHHIGVQAVPLEKDAFATVVICFQYRQNATWQGTITWMDAGRVQHFRSALEMILLLMEITPI